MKTNLLLTATKWASLPCADWPIIKGLPFPSKSATLSTLHLNTRLIEFSTPTIEGTVMRRNKLDGKNEHPWKAEVNEDDTAVEASVISGWYTEVYEPDYTEDVA